MYDLGLDMSIVDFAVRCAVKELMAGDPDRLRADDIAAHIGCSTITVRRTLPRLIESGKLKRYGSKRGGYRYEVKEETSNAARR